MKIKLKRKIYDYLVKNSFFREPDIEENMVIEMQSDSVLIALSDDHAFILQELASELLQKVGYDEDYNLTLEGEILQIFIDEITDS